MENSCRLEGIAQAKKENKSCLNENKINKSKDLIGDSKNELSCAQSNSQETNDRKIISIPKWQITLTSRDCTIKKHVQGWQICPKNKSAMNEFILPIIKVSNSKISTQKITDYEPVKTINAEICCNRDNLDDLFELKENENAQSYGKIVLKDYLKFLSTEEARVNLILKILSKAVREHKIFVILGSFPVLRKPLGRRGWIEKRAIRRMLSMTSEMNEVCGLETIEKLLRGPADFLWYNNKKVHIRNDEKTIVNKFIGCYFTSKVDMCNNLENVYWFFETGVSNIQFPRCYNIYQVAQIEEFVEDFYITACIGILKWFLSLANTGGPSSTCSINGTVPLNAILFALERCVEYISVCAHEDIDREDIKCPSTADWNKFLTWYDQIVNKNQVFIKKDGLDIDEFVKFTANIITEMKECRPQSSIDGNRNVWILKPGDKSLGRGIVLKNNLNEILNKINLAAKEGLQYVVQKYIERPLLVHSTKVDVRQWFLITNTQPLIVWMYNDILLRFASKDFTLDNFHESIHLCNTTVQLKYRKLLRTNLLIPREFHWNLQSFKEYLKATNRESAWEKVIKPAIKENLIGALLASQEKMVNRRNSFQLYGADFVIMDDLSVWLIEINTNPRLHPPSSKVTGKLYPEVIEDTMKVVLDRNKNTNLPGKFECIFKQRNPLCCSTLGQGASLGIRGKGLFANPNPRKPTITL